jgi:hypothetical protein
LSSHYWVVPNVGVPSRNVWDFASRLIKAALFPQRTFLVTFLLVNTLANICVASRPKTNSNLSDLSVNSILCEDFCLVDQQNGVVSYHSLLLRQSFDQVLCLTYTSVMLLVIVRLTD